MRVLSALALLLAAPAWAQDLPGDPVAGEDLARRVCAACHMVAADQDASPEPAAPPFFAIAGDAAATALGLRVFLQTPHGQMPDLILTREEADNIISYILSLK